VHLDKARISKRQNPQSQTEITVGKCIQLLIFL